MTDEPNHRGRPRVGPRLTVRVEPELLVWLNDYAGRLGISRGRVVRNVLREEMHFDKDGRGRL